MIFAVSVGYSQQDLERPFFDYESLEEQFPRFDTKNANIMSLTSYREELEIFRENDLEGFNRELIDYIAQLKVYDKRLLSARRKRQISSNKYKKEHDWLVREFPKTRESGSYMREYRKYLRKYRSQISLYTIQMKNMLKDSLKLP